MPGILRTLVGSYDRELTCGRCRAVVAFLRIRPLRLTRIQHVDGHEVHPYGGHNAVLDAQARLDRLTAAAEAGNHVEAGEVEAARRRVAYATRQFGEIVFVLKCPCGADYLRSLPHLAKAAVAADGSRVELR